MISIIVPVYNRCKTLNKCITSILEQTYNDIEIIAVNNCSTDGSEQIIDEFVKRDSRVKKVNINKKGVSVARNEGIRVANGELIMFVDSDDYIDKDMIQNMFDTLKRNKVKIVKCSYQMECTKNRKEKLYDEGSRSIDTKFWKEFFETYNYNQVWGQLITADLAKKIYFDEEIAMAEDYKYNYELYKNVEQIYVMETIYYHYIINDNGMNYNNEKSKILKKIVDIINVCYDLSLNEKEFSKIIKTRVIKESCSHIINYLSYFEYDVEDLKKAISNDFYTECLKEVNINDVGKYKIIIFLLKTRKYKILNIFCYIYKKMKNIIK